MGFSLNYDVFNFSVELETILLEIHFATIPEFYLICNLEVCIKCSHHGSLVVSKFCPVL